MPERTLPTRSLAVAALAILALGVLAAVAAATPVAQPADDPGAQPADDPRAQSLALPANNTIEDEFVVPAPEEGDEYFEAVATDRRWISYVNPRDEYRSPYLGDGSGKICVTLRNEDGEVVAGESVPDTTVRIPTDETLSWHSEADPIEVEFPLTDNYERPLDSDQFGTSPDVPQGDGYMDSHCVEFHGLDETATIGYGEARVEGERADWIDVVGYVQKTNTWDTDVDPIADAEPYEEAGGWTYEPGESHGQVVVVLQLDPPADAYDNDEIEGNSGEGDDSDGDDEPGSENETGTENGTDGDGKTDTGNQTNDENQTGADGEGSDGGDGTGSSGGDENHGSEENDAGEDALPGFGVGVALAALSIAALARVRR